MKVSEGASLVYIEVNTDNYTEGGLMFSFFVSYRVVFISIIYFGLVFHLL